MGSTIMPFFKTVQSFVSNVLPSFPLRRGDNSASRHRDAETGGTKSENPGIALIKKMNDNVVKQLQSPLHVDLMSEARKFMCEPAFSAAAADASSSPGPSDGGGDSSGGTKELVLFNTLSNQVEHYPLGFRPKNIPFYHAKHPEKIQKLPPITCIHKSCEIDETGRKLTLSGVERVARDQAYVSRCCPNSARHTKGSREMAEIKNLQRRKRILAERHDERSRKVAKEECEQEMTAEERQAVHKECDKLKSAADKLQEEAKHFWNTKKHMFDDMNVKIMSLIASLEELLPKFSEKKQSPVQEKIAMLRGFLDLLLLRSDVAEHLESLSWLDIEIQKFEGPLSSAKDTTLQKNMDDLGKTLYKLKNNEDDNITAFYLKIAKDSYRQCREKHLLKLDMLKALESLTALQDRVKVCSEGAANEEELLALIKTIGEAQEQLRKGGKCSSQPHMVKRGLRDLGAWEVTLRYQHFEKFCLAVVPVLYREIDAFQGPTAEVEDLTDRIKQLRLQLQQPPPFRATETIKGRVQGALNTLKKCEDVLDSRKFIYEQTEAELDRKARMEEKSRIQKKQAMQKKKKKKGPAPSATFIPPENGTRQQLQPTRDQQAPLLALHMGQELANQRDLQKGRGALGNQRDLQKEQSQQQKSGKLQPQTAPQSLQTSIVPAPAPTVSAWKPLSENNFDNDVDVIDLTEDFEVPALSYSDLTPTTSNTDDDKAAFELTQVAMRLSRKVWENGAKQHMRAMMLLASVTECDKNLRELASNSNHTSVVDMCKKGWAICDETLAMLENQLTNDQPPPSTDMLNAMALGLDMMQLYSQFDDCVSEPSCAGQLHAQLMECHDQLDELSFDGSDYVECRQLRRDVMHLGDVSRARLK